MKGIIKMLFVDKVERYMKTQEDNSVVQLLDSPFPGELYVVDRWSEVRAYNAFNNKSIVAFADKNRHKHGELERLVNWRDGMMEHMVDSDKIDHYTLWHTYDLPLKE